MRTQLSQDVREPTKHHDMSQTCHMRHIITPDNQTIKNNFGRETACQMQQFNPIQSKWVVATPMRTV